MDLPLKKIGIAAGVIAIVLLSSAFYAAVQATVAWWCGDRRPEIRTRISLNPFAHGGFFSTLILPLITYWLIGWPIGGPSSIQADDRTLGPPRMALVAVAGVFGNAVFAFLLAVVGAACIAFGYIDDVDRVRSPGYEILTKGMFYPLFSMIMHLIPIPPADGSRIVGAFLPAPIRKIYYSVAPIGGLLMIVVMLWMTGFLYQYFPKVGSGFARELRQFQEWSFDRMDQLAVFFGA